MINREKLEEVIVGDSSMPALNLKDLSDDAWTFYEKMIASCQAWQKMDPEGTQLVGHLFQWTVRAGLVERGVDKKVARTLSLYLQEAVDLLQDPEPRTLSDLYQHPRIKQINTEVSLLMTKLDHYLVEARVIARYETGEDFYAGVNGANSLMFIRQDKEEDS